MRMRQSIHAYIHTQYRDVPSVLNFWPFIKSLIVTANGRVQCWCKLRITNNCLKRYSDELKTADVENCLNKVIYSKSTIEMHFKFWQNTAQWWFTFKAVVLIVTMTFNTHQNIQWNVKLFWSLFNIDWAFSVDFFFITHACQWMWKIYFKPLSSRCTTFNLYENFRVIVDLNFIIPIAEPGSVNQINYCLMYQRKSYNRLNTKNSTPHYKNKTTKTEYPITLNFFVIYFADFISNFYADTGILSASTS